MIRMKAVIYNLVISDGIHEYTKRTISEIWIPSLRVCMNSDNACFRQDTPRSKDGKSFELSNILIDKVSEYMIAKELMDKLLRDNLKGEEHGVSIS